MKLKYRLEKLENALVFQVLWMDERFRASESVGRPEHWVSDRGCVVSSNNRPDLYRCNDEIHIHLPGVEKGKDRWVSAINFSSNDGRDRCFERIHEILKSWANKWDWSGEGENNESVDNTYEV